MTHLHPLRASAAGDARLPQPIRSKRGYIFSAIPAPLQAGGCRWVTWRSARCTEARAAAELSELLLAALAEAFGGGAAAAARHGRMRLHGRHTCSGSGAGSGTASAAPSASAAVTASDAATTSSATGSASGTATPQASRGGTSALNH